MTAFVIADPSVVAATAKLTPMTASSKAYSPPDTAASSAQNAPTTPSERHRKSDKRLIGVQRQPVVRMSRSYTADRSRGESVELDAIDPNLLRALVGETLEAHLPEEQFAVLKVTEASERELLKTWAERLEARP